MDGVREQHHVGIRTWVHPERGSGEAGVAETADGEAHAARHGEGRVDVPAEAAQVLPRDRRVARSEQRIWSCSVVVAIAARLPRWRPRLARPLCPGCCGVVINSRVACVSGKLLGRPASRSSNACAKTLTSCAVENTPACPGHSTHAARRRIVHGAAKQVTEDRDSCPDRLCAHRRVRWVRCATAGRCSRCPLGTRPTPGLSAGAHAIAAPRIVCGPQAFAGGR